MIFIGQFTSIRIIYENRLERKCVVKPKVDLTFWKHLSLESRVAKKTQHRNENLHIAFLSGHSGVNNKI